MHENIMAKGPHLNLYLDTNIYLTFYHFTKEDLTTLDKLIAFIKAGNVILHLPDQTINEFRRNRETKILDAITKLRESRLNDSFPRIAFQYSEIMAMQAAIAQYEKNKSALLEKIQSDAEARALKADDTIDSLFKIANIIEADEYIIEQAVLRFNKGNPPGKDKSYGDAINWEALLEHVPDKQDLHFISDDGDYYSKLSPGSFNTFLLEEWRGTKGSDLIYHKTLTEFLKKNLPEIEINSETDKDIVIMNLASAPNFARAKVVIRNLNEFDNFSIQQLNNIAEAFTSNNQIYWIPDDYEVAKARREIIDKNEKRIEPEIFKAYRNRFSK